MSTDSETKASLPSITAVIVMYNSFSDATVGVDSCLSQEAVDLSVVLVDNGSFDGSGDLARERYRSEPRVAVLDVTPNRGFSGGANAGMAHALTLPTDYVWLLTDDIELHQQAAATLCAALGDWAQAGAAGQYIYSRAERHRIYYAGGAVDRHGTRHRLEGQIDDDSIPAALPQETEFLTGASMLFRPEVLSTVGLMDESFWLYWEDVDLSMRIREAGWTLIVVPASKAWHDVTPPGHGSMPLRLRYYWRNYLRTVRKHALWSSTAATSWALRHIRSEYLREGPRAALAVVLGTMDFWRGRTGPIQGRW
jgi:GT2 family glycosyltransferase